MVSVGGSMVACDPEVIAVIPSGRLGETVSVASAVTGRRVHAELCDSYVLAEERDRNRREMAAFTRRQGKRKGTTL